MKRKVILHHYFQQGQNTAALLIDENIVIWSWHLMKIEQSD